jgi:hypothetical protein
MDFESRARVFPKNLKNYFETPICDSSQAISKARSPSAL